MASEELENSLRKEIDSYVNARLNGLQEEIKRLQSQLNEAFSRLSQRAVSSTQSDVTVGASILEHMRAAHERGYRNFAGHGFQSCLTKRLLFRGQQENV